MSNFRVGSVDGFGERDDIALERDRSQGQATDNYYAKFNNPIPDAPFAKVGKGFKVSEIVKNLVQKGGGSACYFNHQIEWDVELEDARQEAAIDAIIPDGWDTPLTELEQIDVVGRAAYMNQYQIEVRLYHQ
jgi:hypothetical protein